MASTRYESNELNEKPLIVTDVAYEQQTKSAEH